MITNRRLVINLAAFLVLATVVLIWGAVQLLDTRPPTGPRLVVELDATGGITDRTDVTYLGQTVGRVTATTVVGDLVEAEVALEEDVQLPAELDARVRRRSAVGEPYLDLRRSADASGSIAGATVADGTIIPRERTTLPLSYAELFEGVSSLFDAVDVDELGVVIDEFAVMVEGRAPAIRQLLEEGASVATTLGDGAGIIDEAVTEVGQLTALLAAHADGLSGNIDDLRTIGDGLAEVSGAFEQAVTRDPTFVAQVADLLEVASGSVGCTFTSLSEVVGALGDDDLQGLDRVLAGTDELRRILAETLRIDEHGDAWLATELMLSTDQIEQRTPTGRPPAAPTIGACPDGPAATTVAEDGAPPGPGRVGPDRTGAPGDGATDAGDDAGATDGPLASSEADTSGADLPVWAIVIGLLLIATAATRPWRWFRSGRPDG